MAGGIGEAQTAMQTLVGLLPCLFADSKGEKAQRTVSTHRSFAIGRRQFTWLQEDYANFLLLDGRFLIFLNV